MVIHTLGNTVDADLHSGREVVVTVHLPVSGGVYPDIRILAADPDGTHIPALAHHIGIHRIDDGIVTNLTVMGTAVDMLGGTADQHMAFRGDAEHFVVLAAEGKELTGQILLVDMALKLSAQILLLAMLVFGHIFCRPQAAQQQTDEPAVGDGEHILHLAGTHIEPALAHQHFGGEHRIFAGGAAAQHRLTVPGLIDRTREAAGHADLPPETFGRISGIPVDHYQIPADFLFRYQTGTHPQAQPQDRIAGGTGVVGGDVGNGLGVGIENGIVAGHIILQQVIGADHIDEALILGTGGEGALDFKHVEGFVFHRQVQVVRSGSAPHIRGDPEYPVHRFLGGGQIRVIHQIVVILLGDPVDIHHGEGVAAVPAGEGDLVFQRSEGKLRTHAQITGQVGQHSVLQMFAVCLPDHVGGGTLVMVGGGNFPQAHHQNMGQGIQQTVAVFVGGAEGDLLLLSAAVADQRVQTHLGGGHQTGRLNEHHEFHFVEEFPVGLVHLQVMDAGAGDDTHIQFLLLLGQHAHIPHGRNIGHGGQTVLTPGLYTFFRAMAAQHDQHLLVLQQCPVHGEEHVGDQIVIEGVVKQNAFAVQQLLAGEQVVEVQLHAVFTLHAHEAAVSLFAHIVAVFQGAEQLIVGGDVAEHIADGGLFRVQLVGEEFAQHIAHNGVVGDVVSLFRFTFQQVLLLAAGQTVQEEVQFAHHSHAQHRAEQRVQPLIQEQEAGDNHADGTQYHSGHIQRQQEGSCLAEMGLQVPDAGLLVVFIEDTAGFLEQRTVMEQDSQQQLNHQLDQNIAQQDQGICDEIRPQIHIDGGGKFLHGGSQPGQHNDQILIGGGLGAELGSQLQKPFIQMQDGGGYGIVGRFQLQGNQQAQNQTRQRHQVLLIAQGSADIGAAVQPAKQPEGQHHQQHQESVGKISHTDPPFLHACILQSPQGSVPDYPSAGIQSALCGFWRREWGSQNPRDG